VPTFLTVILCAPSVFFSLFWLIQLALTLYHRGGVPAFIDLPDEAPVGGWPALALIFAARNEAAGVERAARSMMTQDYPALEVIAADDRSTDATGAILDRLAAESARLRVVHIRELPDGWLGKPHALHHAAQSASSQWLLFTDGDVLFAPGALRKAIAYALRSGADHVTAAPEVPTESAGERVFMAMFLLMFAANSPYWKVQDMRSGAYLGVGAFNLVRASAFAAIGGFSHLRLSVDDDMRLGQALKLAGYQPRVLIGSGGVSVRWQVGLGGFIRGVEKNFFSAVRFSTPLAIAGAILLLAMGAAPHMGLFVGPWWTRAVCAAGVLSIAGLLSRGRHGTRWYYGFLTPISGLLVAFALLRSTWITLRQGGIRWRDHFYPLGQLRQHIRERDQWLKTLRPERNRPPIQPDPTRA
jgi:hypothetical protein